MWLSFTHRTEQWGARAFSEAERVSWEAKVDSKDKNNKNKQLIYTHI